MAEYSGAATLTTPGGTVTFNGSSDLGVHDPQMCSGLEKLGQIRSVTEDAPRTDGGIVFPRLKAAREIVLGGWCRATTAGARNQWFEDLSTALESILDGGGSYVWVEATTGTNTLSDVWCDIPPNPSGAFVKKYQFGLIAPNPTIT
jgi:hypothetical protein